MALVLLIWHYGNVQFYVTDKGLWKKGVFQQQFMSWDEVRLFAIDSVSIEKRGLSLIKSSRAGAPVFFELSSQKEIISWQWLHPQRWYCLQVARPVMGYAAYNQQMQSLLSIITEKTGQPLYDLRS
ncbi:hypothetical protein KDH_51340 [Dictyobacter sp. S3.2.2.5]|uniref:Uncharacterized protein n=1 Tax=Dictyobacter halimunensis TaxID=3026934 RepID=A0ABQ6FX63_9CHLR|nr:hypothetical protein KDH_51340 [Dictyobacter sp. S3.2.2.5]